MGRMNTLGGRWFAVAGLLVFGLVRTAAAIYVDEDQNISLRARVYSQASIRTWDSQPGTVPTAKLGQLVQHRNFFNPELDAKLTSYLSFMKGGPLDWLAPDDFSGRVAAWGFYDGIYDYGSSQFDDTRRLINSTFGSFNPVTKGPAVGPDGQGHAWFLEGPKFNRNCQRGVGRCTVDQIFPGREVLNPRDIYATQRRVNELYLSYTKGPIFLRVGRQVISWGESDTIAILDQNNPFDFTVAAPGLFEDLEEARIPLWTVRGSVTAFDTLGPFSSGFLEAYWVPGDLDVNTGFLPMLTASPYSPRNQDPQTLIPQLSPGVPAIPAQFVLLDHVPRKRFENSRYGIRAQTVVGRTHTLSTWYYTTFPSTPVPQGLGITRTVDGNQIFAEETVHRMTGVLGLADTFFFEPADGIVRAEAEYFIGEPSFTPEDNLQITKNGGLLDPIRKLGRVPRADYLRWELGFDRFFFARPINPTNSFVWVTAVVGSWNLSETSRKDFRFDGLFKQEFFEKPPGTSPKPNDFVQQKKVEVFGQTHVQTDYMHGRLQPAVTIIGSARGTWAVNPSVTYRWTDSLLFTASYITINGEFQSLGFFRDRDQVSLRATYQLN